MPTSILRSREGFLRFFGNSLLHCCVTSSFVVFYIILYNTTKVKTSLISLFTKLVFPNRFLKNGIIPAGQVNLVENTKIADEQTFLDPMGKNGKELESENDQLAKQIDQLPGEFWRIKMLKVTT